MSQFLYKQLFIG